MLSRSRHPYDYCQWRIQDFPEGGSNSQSGIILQIYCRKPHENEKIWGTSLAPMIVISCNKEVRCKLFSAVVSWVELYEFIMD